MRQYALATPGCNANRPRKGRNIEDFMITDLSFLQYLAVEELNVWYP